MKSLRRETQIFSYKIFGFELCNNCFKIHQNAPFWGNFPKISRGRPPGPPPPPSPFRRFAPQWSLQLQTFVLQRFSIVLQRKKSWTPLKKCYTGEKIMKFWRDIFTTFLCISHRFLVQVDQRTLIVSGADPEPPLPGGGAQVTNEAEGFTEARSAERGRVGEGVTGIFLRNCIKMVHSECILR